jgi:hypothetical protein
MPYRIVSNKLNGKVTIHVVGANSGDIIVAGNNSVSNIATGAEILNGAYIRKLYWNTDSPWVIKRGANTVLVLGAGAGPELDLSALPMSLDYAANVSCNTVAATANAFLILELSKVAYGGNAANTGY